jgi:hypothetical protein
MQLIVQFAKAFSQSTRMVRGVLGQPTLRPRLTAPPEFSNRVLLGTAGGWTQTYPYDN